MQFSEPPAPEDQFVLSRQAFNRDSFRRLIKKTFDDYNIAIYNKENFDLDEYMELVGEEKLEAKFAVYLEKNTENEINIQNMPWLDIGDLPVSYEAHKEEAF